MSQTQVKWALLLLGAFAVAAGVFAPFVTVPIIGSINLLTRDATLAGVVLGGVALTVFLGWLRQWVISGYMLAVAGGALVYLLAHTSLTLQGSSRAMAISNNDGLAGALGQAFAGAIQYSWGVPLLVGGLLIMLAGSLIRPSETTPETHKKALPHLVTALIAMLGLGSIGVVQGQKEADALVAKAEADAAAWAEQARLAEEQRAEEQRQAEEAAAAAAQAEAEEELEKQAALNLLTVENLDWRYDDYSTYLTGTLRNGSDRGISSIFVSVNFYNDAEQILDEGLELADYLAPGEEKLLEFYVPDADEIRNAWVTEIKGTVE